MTREKLKGKRKRMGNGRKEKGGRKKTKKPNF